MEMSDQDREQEHRPGVRSPMSIRKKAKAPLTKCECGQPLPTHLADLVDESFTHVCSCKKAYKVCSGLFIHIGEEDNPSAAFDEEVASTKCKRCKGGMDYIWVSLFHQITNKADKFPPFCMDCSRDILEDAEKYGL
jgi:hypothetical protein